MKKTVFFLICLLPALVSPVSARERGPSLAASLFYTNPVSSELRYLDDGFGHGITFGYDSGPVAIEAEWFRSSNDDTDPGYGGATLRGFSLDVKVFLSYIYDPTQTYFLIGLGNYSIREYDPVLDAETTLRGSGVNLGAGAERYIKRNLSLNLEITYRAIRYDWVDINSVRFLVNPELKGDTATVEAGLIYHF